MFFVLHSLAQLNRLWNRLEPIFICLQWNRSQFDLFVIANNTNFVFTWKTKTKTTKSSLKWKQKREVRTLHLYVTLISIERFGNFIIRHRFSFWQQLTALKLNSQKVIEKLQLNMCFLLTNHCQNRASKDYPFNVHFHSENLFTILNIV